MHFTPNALYDFILKARSLLIYFGSICCTDQRINMFILLNESCLSVFVVNNKLIVTFSFHVAIWKSKRNSRASPKVPNGSNEISV